MLFDILDLLRIAAERQEPHFWPIRLCDLDHVCVFLSTYLLCVSILNRGGGAGGLPALRRRRGCRGAGARRGGAPAAGGTLVERDGDRAATHRQRGWRLGQAAEHLAANHLISTGNVVLQRLVLINTKLAYHVLILSLHRARNQQPWKGEIMFCITVCM